MRTIDPIFKEMGIRFEENLSKDAIDVPINHPAYKDIWRRIDNYTDKVYLVKEFQKDEQKNNQESDDELQAKYNMLEQIIEIDDQMKKASKNGRDGLIRAFRTNMNRIIEKINRAHLHTNQIDTEMIKYFKNDPNIPSTLTNEMIVYLCNNFYDDEISESKLIKKMQKINNQFNNRFSDEIKRRYPYDFKEGNRIKLEKSDTARQIIEDKKRIREDFQNMLSGLDEQDFKISISNAYNPKNAIKEHITRELEKFYGLRFNKKNGLFYISDGEGMYIQFNDDNLGKTFKKFHDKFFIKTKKDKNSKEIVDKRYYWTKAEFFNLASEYCIIETESEANIIAFPNCAYDIKTKKIYDLDYRLPRLPMKQCEINFVFHKDLNTGGALQQVFEYCFDEETRQKIFQHYGKALFERGYTESQSSLFLMGKGNVGKTTFIESLNMIFQNRRTVDSGQFKSDNDFKFGVLAETDIVLLDEISNAKKAEFLEILKLWTGGAESIMCNPKYGRQIQLDAEYIPRLVATGNNLPDKLYEGAQGVGVLRRFDICFLKNSILEAKLFTVEIQNQEYPAYQENNNLYIIKEPTDYTKDKEAIGQAYKFINGEFIPQFDNNNEPKIITQGRTYFTQDELRTKEALEWFLQQVILNYEPETKKTIDEEELRERFLKAYEPERWVIANHIITHYTDEKVSKMDDEYEISAEELLAKIHEVIEDNMLEKSVSNPNSDKFKKMLKETLNINQNFEEIVKGEKIFYGLEFE